ncbi:MAG: hypothetical protein ACE5QW_07440 [Thermoplasmata archaeon]
MRGNHHCALSLIWVFALLLVSTGPLHESPSIEKEDTSEGPIPMQETWSSLWEGDGVSSPSSEGWWLRPWGFTSIYSDFSDGETVAIVDDPDPVDGAWMQRWVDFEPPFKLAARGRYDPATSRTSRVTMAYFFTGCHKIYANFNPTYLRIGGPDPFDIPAVQGTWYNVTFDVRAPLDVDVYLDGILVGNVEMAPSDRLIFDSPDNKPVIATLISGIPTSLAMVDYIRTTMQPIGEVGPKTCDREAPLVLNVTLDDGMKTPSNDLLVSEGASTVWLNATIDDRTTGNSPIWSANYTAGASNWPGTPMTAADSAFDSPVENVTVSIDVSGFAEGNYTLCVYGRDYYGNWNTTGSCATMRIGKEEPPRIYGPTLDDGVQPPSSFLEVALMPSTTVWLNATIDDTFTGNSSILSANYTEDPQVWPGAPMSPSDGDLDSPLENVTASLDIMALGEGNHTLCVYAIDVAGNANLTGSCAFLNITYVPPSSWALPLVPYWWNIPPVMLITVINGSYPIDSVELYCNYSSDNASWSGWSICDTVTSPPWTPSSLFPAGDGHYMYYSIARDFYGFEEGPPLVADAMAGYDTEPPTSSVQPLVPYWRNVDTLDLVADADDDLSGVANVTFLYRFSNDNSSWTDWAPVSTDTVPPYDATFVASEGDGYYQFRSDAYDVAGNAENDTQPEAWIAIDTQGPLSSILQPSPYWTNHPDVLLEATGTDELSGIAQITLYYRFSSDNATWTSWAPWGTDDSAPWNFSFVAADEDGYYEFYSLALDNLGNSESSPISADALIALDTLPPTSSLNPLSDYWFADSSAPLFTQAFDEMSGVDTVELLYRWSEDNITFTSWISAAISSAPPWSFSYNAPDGDGFYELMTIAVDRVGNVEVGNLAEILLAIDTTPPTTEALPVIPYTRTAMPVAIDAQGFDALSGLAAIQLLYRFSEDNLSWSAFQSLGQVSDTPYEWNFSAPDGEGYYEFITQGRDFLGNAESAPETADSSMAYFRGGAPPNGDGAGGVIQENWKPFLALAFTIVLLVVASIMITRRAVVGLSAPKAKKLLAVAILFSVLELMTGAISMVTPALAIPPAFGMGTFIDAVILAVGLAILLIVGFRKGAPDQATLPPPPED